MKAKDYIIITILLAIVAMLMFMIKKSKAQPILVHGGKEVIPKYFVKQGAELDSPEDSKEEDPTQEKRTRKVRLKKTYSRLLKILKADDAPYTAAAMLPVHNGKYKEINITKIKMWLKWLTERGFTMVEEMEDGTKVYGLIDWFDNGELQQDYFKKIKTQ